MEKIILFNRNDNFFDIDGAKVKEKQGDFLLQNRFLIPLKFLSNNILLITNGKNYWLSKMIKCNKKIDSLITLENNHAFDVYCYFKCKNQIVNDASKIIDKFEFKYLNMFCNDIVSTIEVFENKDFPKEYVFRNVLLFLCDYEYDDECIDFEGELLDNIEIICDNYNNNIDINNIYDLILKYTCNNTDLLDKLKISFDLEKIVNVFSKNYVKKYEKLKNEKKKKTHLKKLTNLD